MSRGGEWVSNKKKEKQLFDQVKDQTSVSEKKIRALANKIDPKDLQDEKKVRQLIAQVATVAGIGVSKEKEDQIVNYLVKNKASMEEMQMMIQMFMQSKK